MKRRRFRHDDGKLEIDASVGIEGATVTQVAQRNEVTRRVQSHDISTAKTKVSTQRFAFAVALALHCDKDIPAPYA